MPALLARRILAVVRPTIARVLVTWMRRLEEATTDPAARWELLRRTLERMEREQP